MGQLVRIALAAAEAAARVHLTHVGRVRTVDAREKGTSDFVSWVDLEAQQAAVEVIHREFPHHSILAEEEGEERGTGTGLERGPSTDRERQPGTGSRTPTWVIDPLDGTTNFLHGHPAYCCSVGVVREGLPVAGAVVAAATAERWWAERGEGAYRDGERIRVSATSTLDHALIGTGFPFKRLERLPEYLEQFARVLPATSGVRRCGSAALDLCYLAQGSLDAFWEIHLAPWDIAGGLCILEAAGGVSRGLEEETLDPLVGGGVLAANSVDMLDALRERIRG